MKYTIDETKKTVLLHGDYEVNTLLEFFKGYKDYTLIENKPILDISSLPNNIFFGPLDEELDELDERLDNNVE